MIDAAADAAQQDIAAQVAVPSPDRAPGRPPILDVDAQNRTREQEVRGARYRRPAYRGNRRGLRGSGRCIRICAGELVLGRGRASPGQHRRRGCRTLRPPGRGGPGSAGARSDRGEGGGRPARTRLGPSLGRVIPRRWLLAGATAASVLLVGYGGLSVLLGALVLSGVIHPAGGVDRAALRWHVGVWDLWFLVWGILLALATVSYRRRTKEQGASM